jgi:aryl-alcohol dehydrogenase-like predicted oxidoreductase
MKYNRLIKDAPLVSEIGIGAWQLGVNSGWKSMSEDEAVEIIKVSLEEGVNFF